MGVCFHWGCSFLRAFEIKRYIKKDVKMLCKWASLYIGAPLGKLDILARTFLREKDSISGFLSWTQRTLRFEVWGQPGTW